MATTYDDYTKARGGKERSVKKESKPGGLGGFLSSLLPTGGGVGGALAGAAGGAALGSAVPIVGTAIGGLLGAIAGGAGGSAVGKFGQNALEGKQDLGEGVGEEALIGGLTSTPITGGLKLLKGAAKAPFVEGAFKKGAQEAGASAIPKMATGLREKAGAELANAGEVASKPGLLNRIQTTGSDMRRDVAGTSRVSDSYTRELDLLDALERNGLKGSASNQYKNIDKSIGKLSEGINAELSVIKNSVPRSDTVNSLRTRVLDEIPEDAMFTRELDRSLSRISKNAANDIDAKELFAIKQEVGNRLGNAFKKLERGGNLTTKEEVDMALWKQLDNEITTLAPTVKQATLDQSKLIAARPALQKQSEKTAGIPLLGVKSKTLERMSQSGRDVVGRAATGKGIIGRATADAASKAEIPAGQGILGAVTRESLLGTRPSMGAEAMPDEALALDETALAGAELGAEEQVDETAQLQERIKAAALQALAAGDTKGLDSIMQVASLLQSFAPAQEKPMSAEASKVVGNANSGLDSLSQLENIIAGQGGEVSKATLVPGRDLFGNLGSNVLGTAEFDNASKNLADVITRLRTGAALTDSEEKFYKAQLPQAFDSPEVIQQKLGTFRDLFQSVASRTGTSGTDIQSAVGM